LVLVYCKTGDDPKIIADYVCKANFGEVNGENKSQIIKDENEDDCWLLQSKSMDETSAIIYRIGPEIVALEIDDDCAQNIIEPLMKKYGFNKVKWLLSK
jgi:hypothetical protein